MRLLPAVVVSAALSLLALPSTARADESPSPPASRMQSPALFGSGLALTIAGTAAVPLGALVLVARTGTVNCVQAPCGQPDETGATVAGGMLVGVGAAAVLAGVPMMIFGLARAPVTVAAGPGGTPGMTLALRF